MASFLGDINVGDYDLAANEELKKLLDRIKEV